MSSRVVVVGSLNLDTVYRVLSLPARGQTIAAHRSDQCVGGKGGNQALAASAAGSPVVMVGCVGKDAAGHRIVDDLSAGGVDVQRIARADAATGEALVVVSDDAENHILVVAGANDELGAASLETHLADLNPGDVVLLQNEIPAATTARAASIARDKGASVIWNAAPAPADRAEIPSDLDVVIVNEGELRSLADVLELPSGSGNLIDRLARLLGVTVVCTLGADGALLSDGHERTVHPAPRVQAVDTTAAGDTFTGYYAALAHLPQTERLAWATAAGAQAVTRAGASPSIPTRAQVAPLVPHFAVQHAGGTP
ncbi:ribokinase [Kineosporia babensis]|uniref:Ribokinase n=1 Tax=Kineosporia babensis TaxID=499548 RepID=A0A9X1SVW5_9ACTN|nr:ribokinase [Kineosporia babensis]MCD5314094.1 ribokinase [Kineosporia babensis]